MRNSERKTKRTFFATWNKFPKTTTSNFTTSFQNLKLIGSSILTWSLRLSISQNGSISENRLWSLSKTISQRFAIHQFKGSWNSSKRFYNFRTRFYKDYSNPLTLSTSLYSSSPRYKWLTNIRQLGWSRPWKFQ